MPTRTGVVIVGAVDMPRQQPDPNNGLSRWLATKDATYQARIKASEVGRRD